MHWYASLYLINFFPLFQFRWNDKETGQASFQMEKIQYFWNLFDTFQRPTGLFLFTFEKFLAREREGKISRNQKYSVVVLSQNTKRLNQSGSFSVVKIQQSSNSLTSSICRENDQWWKTKARVLSFSSKKASIKQFFILHWVCFLFRSLNTGMNY